MTRQSVYGDEPWDERHDELQMRTRVFAREVEDALSASLHELLPGAPGDRLHMHYGIEEMFFVLSGTPILQRRDGRATRVRRRSALSRRTGGAAHLQKPDGSASAHPRGVITALP